jgi:hypothetical protein
LSAPSNAVHIPADTAAFGAIEVAYDTESGSDNWCDVEYMTYQVLLNHRRAGVIE